MGTVDTQATTARERLARRRRRRRITRIALFALLLVAVGAFLLYRSYLHSVGGGAPEEGVHVLLAVVEEVPEAVGQEGAAAGEEGAASAEQTESSAEQTGSSGPEGPARGPGRANRRELQAAALFALDPVRKRAILVSLPADTWLGDGDEVDGGASLADRYGQDGLDGLQAAAEALLGLPIHHRMEVDMGAVVDVVDILPAGVPVTVRTPIVYRNAEGEEVFRLDPGDHVLDGQAALLFLRYRGDDWVGEVPRAQRQRDFVVSLARTVLQQASVRDIRDLFHAVQERVTTDLGPVQMVRLADLVRELDPDAIEFVLLPGRAEEGRWVPDGERVRQLAARLVPRTPEGQGRDGPSGR